MIQEFLDLSTRIEKGFVYVNNATGKDKEKSEALLKNLIEEYEKKLEFVTDEDTRKMLTRIFILSVRG